MKRKVLFLAVFLSAVQVFYAQNADKRYAFGLSLGKNEYWGELGNGIFNWNKTPYGFVGLSFSTYISPSFDFGTQVNYGDYGYFVSSGQNIWGKKLAGSLYTHYKFNNGYILNEKSFISPFIELGVGAAKYNNGGLSQQYPRIDPTGYDLLIPVGAGLKFQLSDNVAFQYKYVYNFTNHDFREVLPTKMIGGANDVVGEHFLSFVFSFGAAKDEDKDGVPDKYDKCPGTPAGVKVDALGCPVDSDGDGVADYLDKCPNTLSGVQVDAQGCPVDSDGDGVADYLDKCPNTPSGVTVDAAGCPIDSDGDGVADYLDKCPNTPAGEKVNASGCPMDSDGDGVPDNLDKCPNTPKGVKVDANGCPLDRDGDGVPDYMDKCPDVKGIAANKGCPEVKAETKKIFAQALQGIQFETGKDVIKKGSYPILDKVVKVMKDNPSYDLEINGHTDNQGNAAMNLGLSDKRANAVKTYLTKAGIEASRLTAKGFGQTMPVADNATVAGRAKNRRVEFKVNF
jgi:OmpA-OmpF porin, OOP family